MGGAGADEIFGDVGNDTLQGNSAGLSDTSVDFLNGGAGDDVLLLGAGDYGHGDAGADAFTLTDFGMGGEAVQITDFDPAEDQLILLYDPALADSPSATLAEDAAGNTQILLDGNVVAILTNGVQISTDDIILRAG
jgi:Ca2+-binding RTX toxin-like protein